MLALMLLHEARRLTRTDAAGDFVPLEDQNRSLWDRALIAEAQALIEHALKHQRIGPYIIQAAIAELHSSAPSLADTDWSQIVGLYDTLVRIAPSPVVAVNRAVAIGQRDGSEAGLVAIEAAMADGSLDGYHLAYAALADLNQRLGNVEKAAALYGRSRRLVTQPIERKLLEKRYSTLT